MGKVVQENPAYCQKPKILYAAGFPGLEPGVPGLKGPGDEGSEALGLILEITQSFQMLQPIFQGFYMPKHHGGCGSKAHLVGQAHDMKPFVSTAFVGGYPFPHLVYQNFSSASGDGVQAAGQQTFQDFGWRSPVEAGEVHYLRRGKGMDVQSRELGFNVLQ